MRLDELGRKRKPLEEKSTSLIIRIDNKTLFKICDFFGIKYNREAEILENEIKSKIIGEIKKIIEKFVK